MRIIKEQTTGLIIDIQERLVPHMYEKDRLIEKSCKLINGLNALNVPVKVTQQYTKGLGETIPEISGLVEKFESIEKVSFSCCGVPDFMMELKKLNRKNVIILGIESHVCVLQTVIDLIENKYQPIVIADCISSRKPDDIEIAIQRMQQEGAIISTLESILFELCVEAGNDTFKAISKIVK